MISAAPCSVSSDFGQLVVMRHFNSGIDCAMAGAAMLAAPAAPNPVTLIKSRRFMEFPSPFDDLCQPSFRGLDAREHEASDFGFPRRSLISQRKKPGAFLRRATKGVFKVTISRGC